MRNNRLNWVLLLTIAWAGQSLQYVCRQSQDCTCSHMPPDKYEMECFKNSATTFVIKERSKYWTSVKCNKRSLWSDFKLNSTAEVEDVHTFTFEQCELPDSSLHEITQRIGVQPIDTLGFESHKNLSSTLERRHLSGFSKLKVLSLSSNGLTKLPDDLLMDLPELTQLVLRENNVILSLQFFNSAVPKLEVLELGNNKLTHIDPMLFRSLERLTYLALYSNELTHIEENMFENLSALRTLDVSGNNLTTLLPDVFKPLRNLSLLHISANHFTSLPEGLLSNNLNLTRFQLHYNQGNMSTLPSRFFGNLLKLKEIYMNYDHLEVLPEDIFRGSPSITDITLTGNSFSTLPRNIFNETKNLELLDLSSNVLTNLPDGIFEVLKKLKKLELQNNNLTFISEQLFSGLSDLEEINLEYNGLRSIAAFGFYYLQSLEVARLSHNQLTLLENQTTLLGFTEQSPFFRCEKLRKLYLAHNNITMIFSDWAWMLSNLQMLDLKYNQISTVSDADFQFLSQNILIDITHNNISEIHLGHAELIATAQNFDMFDTRNVQILIEENPIVCDCDLYDFLKYLDGEMHPDVQKLFHITPGTLICNGPKGMHKTPISELKSKTLLCAIPDCPEKCTCWFRRYDDTFIANCSYRNLNAAPERIVSRKDGKVELDLTGNLLTEVPFINQSGYGSISKLLLSHNNISVISSENIPPTLEVLELHNNNLTRMDSMVLERFRNSTSLKSLTLHENPWKCDDEARDFIKFILLNFKVIPYLSNVTCQANNQPVFDTVVSDSCSVTSGTIVVVSVGIALLDSLIGKI